MRYLNRIIFINSAHIPYCELKLDGNVHFIGTQGVGKSTLLRAILFFYNADKGRLGIQREQRSFDEFYLGHSNSYIIYEVQRENGRFFIQTVLSQGRAAFRFIDCAYERRYFIDSEGNAYYDWGTISQQIGVKVFKSSLVRSYQMYRDILYGNKQAVPRELQRFSIMESTRYQNIPLTIQNIFLNQSLESRVIKDTIIDSMGFGNDVIKLNTLRDHLKDFRQQYRDVSMWFKREKNGKVTVRTQADSVIENFSLYKNAQDEALELSGQLIFALDRDQRQLPLLKTQIDEEQQKLDREKRLAQEEDDKHRNERDHLNQQLGVLNEKLKTIQKKRAHYQELNIDDIVRQTEREGQTRSEHDSLVSKYDALTAKNKNVRDKYDLLKTQEQMALKNFEMEQQKRSTAIKNQRLESLEKLNTRFTQQKDDIAQRIGADRKDLQGQKDSLNTQLSDLRVNLQKVRQGNPYADQMEELRQELHRLEGEENRIELDINQRARQRDQLLHTLESDKNQVERKKEREANHLQTELDKILEQVSQLQALLDRRHGSLEEWLSEHKPGWENTIGKVVDEEQVLYNTDLNPQLSGTDDSLFGVSLELGNIDRDIRTPKQIEQEKTALEQKVEAQRKAIRQLDEQLQADIKVLENSCTPKLKDLKNDILTLETQKRVIPNKHQKTTEELNHLSEQLAQWRQEQETGIKQHIDTLQQQLAKLNQADAELSEQERKEVDKVQREYNKAKRDLDAWTKESQQALNQETVLRRDKTQKALEQIERQMDQELKGQGVDIDELSRLRGQMKQLEETLEFVYAHRNDYVAWVNDKRELFDREQEFRDDHRKLKLKLDDLDHKYEERRSKRSQLMAQISAGIGELRHKQEDLQTTISQVENFQAGESWKPAMANASPKETVKPLASIKNELTDVLLEKGHRFIDFKSAVTRFKGNFSPQNTFHFPTELNQDSDYFDFANNLNDFLIQNKIEEYRNNINKNYEILFGNISREVGGLMNNSSQVRATILEINRDFRENNFTGVIKDIELRPDESSDPMMRLLLSIKRFCESASFNVGQFNLFTDEEQLAKNNQTAFSLISQLIERLDVERKRDYVTQADTFKLVFRVRENDNDTGYVEKLSNVGSDGTDILVKSMINIMLINVFKRKASKKFGDFRLHCMMDEIGKLHPDNVKGILDFANRRNIYLINSSPTTYNAEAYRYTYALTKDSKSRTHIETLLTIN